MALCGHPLLFCSVFEHLPLVSRQPFLVELATLPHRPWAPKPSEPSNSGFSSTKTPFLCAFCLRNPRFGAFRAQNRDFCALLPSETPIFRHFEHKIEVFVLGKKGIGIGKNKYGRSCKSPRTPLKCKVLITRQLTFEGVLDELKLCSPSTAIKYNYLCIRCLCFESVLGDLHERRTHQVAALSGTQHLRPWPGDSLIWRRYGGGVGNRCRWADRFASV